MAGNQSDLGFGGARPTTSIINVHSSGGTQSSGISASALPAARALLSGALTAATLATLLNVTNGSGRVPVLAVGTLDATPRTARLKVTVDGTVVFDATSSSIAANGNGIFAAGSFSSSGVFIPAEPIVFLQSFKVEVASSLSETDKLQLLYLMHRS